MNLKYPNYFLQSQCWADFWLEINKGEHQYYLFEQDLENEKISCLVYEYPWYLEEKFRYIPRFPGLGFNLKIEPDLLKKLSLKLLQKIIYDCKERNICFLKIDFEDQFKDIFDIQTDEKLMIFLKENFEGLKIKYSTKKLQWNQTITLDIGTILEQKEKIVSAIDQNQVLKSKLLDFFQTSKEFWKTTNNNVRRYTKKVLEGDWEILITKSDENFEAFWQVYNQTKDRQQFSIYTKDYFDTLFKKTESRIIVLKNKDQVVASWFGLVSENTLTYLYGGNTAFSLENYGQYLLHLVAINLAFEENLRFYDLGGFDPDHGYGKFKENYKGYKRIFPGPVDIVFKPFKFNLITLLSKLRNIF